MKELINKMICYVIGHKLQPLQPYEIRLFRKCIRCGKNDISTICDMLDAEGREIRSVFDK